MAEKIAVDPGTPLWWLLYLEPKLYQRQQEMQKMEAYYLGDHPLPFLTQAHAPKMRNQFRELLDDSKSNFMRLVVDACEERMRVEGFRLSASSDELADKESWDIWQANNMDAESQTAFVESMVKGMSYLSVWHDGDPERYPTIAVEDPLETIVAYTPGSSFRSRDAALKIWIDDLSDDRRANVYLPEGVYKFQSSDTSEAHELVAGADPNYAQKIDAWKALDAPNDFVGSPQGVRVVPIIPIRNRPRLVCEGESELYDLTPMQDYINGQVFNLALVGYFGAHRQRWAIGMKLMEDEHGNTIEPFDAAIDKLWATEQPPSGEDAVQFGEFNQTDPSGYIKLIEQKVLHIAVVSRTPRHYLIQDGQSPSGDALRSAEAGLVKKTLRKERTMGENLEEAIRLARRFSGKTDTAVDSEIVWADPETRTMAETTDAVIKQYSAGLIPLEVALEDLGKSQTQIRRIMAGRMQDSLLAALAAPDQQPQPDKPVVV